MAMYTIKGQRIYAREDGPANAQVAILIHGWSSSWYAMSPLLPLLNKRFSCVAVDLPGYGNSPPPSQRVTIPWYADLIAELIQEISDGPVVLVGHSMGGMISLTLAKRHPVLVERMVLLAPTISGNLSALIKWTISPITVLEQFALANQVIAAIEPHLLKVTDRLMRPASFADRTEITEQEYKRLRADARRPGQGRVRAQCYWAMRQNDLTTDLHNIEAPSIVLWGAEDNTVPLRDAGVLVDECRSADLRIIPKAGHWPQFETPQITKRYIASYLGLPLVTTRPEDANTQAAKVSQAAQFLAHSDVGSNMNLPQRTRLAAQCKIRSYDANSLIAQVQDTGTDLYIVQDGTVEVWNDPSSLNPNLSSARRLVATLLPGQITGELALLDGGRRSADLRAGEEGATVLILNRERLIALCDDDPALGTLLIWNIAAALALRLRLTNLQLQLATGQAQTQPSSAVSATAPAVAEKTG